MLVYLLDIYPYHLALVRVPNWTRIQNVILYTFTKVCHKCRHKIRLLKKIFHIKEQLAHDIDLAEQKKLLKESIRAETEDAFEFVAREWYAQNQHTWTPKHQQKLMSRFETNIFPALGKKNIKEITAPDILKIIQVVENRGFFELTHRLVYMCSQVFRYAIITGKVDRDPAQDLRVVLKPNRSKSMASVKDPKDVGKLLRNIEEYSGNFIVKTALRIAPYVFVHPGELRRAEWSEFDFEKAEWRIPAERMKMRIVHIVPLAKQVIAILQKLHEFTGHLKFKTTAQYCASSRRSSLVEKYFK